MHLNFSYMLAYFNALEMFCRKMYLRILILCCMLKINVVSGKRKVVIDHDTGIDDAQAILMAVKDPDVEVLALTSVGGNANATQAAKNALRTLKVFHRLDIPVYTGCNGGLVRNKPVSDFHGNDGFGDVTDSNPPDEGLIQSKHAVDVLLHLSKEHKGELTLVCQGPLTNIAMAIRMDPMFGNRLKEVFIMGGTHKGKGNITPSAEFNFFMDPEAANVVLNHLGAKITMVTWETCEKHSLSWDFYDKVREPNTPVSKFLRSIEENTTATFFRQSEWNGYITPDEIIMACFLNSSVIHRSNGLHVDVEYRGELTAGQMIVDWYQWLQKPNNAVIVRAIHQDIYENMLLQLALWQG